MNDQPALSRLCELEEIAACFVFTREGKIVARAVPENYTELMLAQVTMVLGQVIASVEKTKVPMREARFVFESYGVWLKFFGFRQILAIFLHPGTQANLLRQPINLAIVNLEKALNRDQDERPVSEMAEMLAASAHQAELEMLRVEGVDTNEVFERLVSLTEFFLGPVAVEVLEHGLRERQMHLPIQSRKDLVELVEYCLNVMDNPEVKKAYADMADDLMERVELEMVGTVEKKKVNETS
ncbi:MAG: hypothetical protein HC904_11775 [Blastochloris sp.]|nr:hypothetical protein [Blastochloris sp.]